MKALASVLFAVLLATGCDKPANQPQKQPVAKPAPAAAPKTDPEKEDFLAFVRQHAEDPTELEIVAWGDKVKEGRGVTFRCARIGALRTGPKKLAGPSVSLEETVIEYKDGRIWRAYLPKTYQWWYAPQKD